MARRSSRRRSSRRRSSKRRSSRRRSSRRLRRNQRWVVRNKRRRRLRRNQFFPTGAVFMRDVVTPVVGGSVGFIAARYLGNWMAMRDLGTSDPKIAKTIAAAVGIPAVYALRTQFPAIGRNAGALVLGMGMASAEAWIRDTPLLGGSPAAAAITEPAPAEVDTAVPVPIPEADIPGEVEVVENGGDGGPLSSYYDDPTTQHGQASDYYSGAMLGDHPGAEAISTVTPTGVAMRATPFPQVREVTEQFASQGDRGHAGGIFARTLYSGMIS